MAKSAKIEKVWPTSDDLLCWFIYDKIDQSSEVLPEHLIEWLKEFKETKFELIHKILYMNYQSFQDKYLPVEKVEV